MRSVEVDAIIEWNDGEEDEAEDEDDQGFAREVQKVWPGVVESRYRALLQCGTIASVGCRSGDGRGG